MRHFFRSRRSRRIELAAAFLLWLRSGSLFRRRRRLRLSMTTRGRGRCGSGRRGLHFRGRRDTAPTRRQSQGKRDRTSQESQHCLHHLNYTMRLSKKQQQPILRVQGTFLASVAASARRALVAPRRADAATLAKLLRCALAPAVLAFGITESTLCQVQSCSRFFRPRWSARPEPCIASASLPILGVAVEHYPIFADRHPANLKGAISLQRNAKGLALLVKQLQRNLLSFGKGHAFPVVNNSAVKCIHGGAIE